MKKIVPLVAALIIVIAIGGYFVTKKDPIVDRNVTTTSTNQTTNETNKNTATPTNSTESTTTTEAAKTAYTLSEVATHNKQSDCWTTINGNVYNITSYVPRHPGGVDEITQICGKDGKSLFEGNPQHNSTAKSQLESLKIGTLI